MKKSVVLVSGVCLVALIGGGFYAIKGFKNSGEERKIVNASPETYWDKTSDINAIGADGTLPLVKAVEARDIKNVNYLLEKGAKPQTADKNSMSALDMAIKVGDAAILNKLIDVSQAFLTAPDQLKLAIESNNPEVVQIVLDHGGNANKILEITGKYRPDEELDYMDPRVISPLKKAVEEDRFEIVKVLIKNGAEGADFFLLSQFKKNNLNMVKALTENMNNLRRVSVKGTDLLSSAAVDANTDMIEFLLEKNAGNVNNALFRALAYRKSDNAYEETFDKFLSAGAVPTPEVLEFILKRGKTDLFKKAGNCLVNADIKLQEQDVSLLKFALDEHYDEAAVYLIERGADIWRKEKDGQSAVMQAVSYFDKHPDVYKAIKDKLEDINETGYEGETLLMLVAKRGLLDEFRKLVDAGADIWQKDINGGTVLMYAVQGGNKEIIRYLLNKGDNISSSDKHGKTVLMYAAEGGNVDACKELLHKGADIKERDENGKTAIMYAAKSGKSDVVSFLLNFGESVQSFDNKRKNVVMYAAESGDYDTFKVVSSKGYEAYLQDRDGISVLAYAVEGNNLNIVEEVIKQPIDKTAADNLGYTPFIRALRKGNADIANLFVNYIGVDSGVTSDNGKSIPMHAYEGGNLDLIRLAISRAGRLIGKKDNSGVSFVMQMARDGRPDMVNAIIARGNSLIEKDENNKTILMYASEGEAAVNLISILKNLNDHEINKRDKNWRSALMYAIGFKYNPIIKVQRLLQRGANPNHQDVDGKSVLMYAVGNPYAFVDNQVVKTLLHSGADVSAKDNLGRTALMYAAGNVNAGSNIVETLISAGALINDKDNKNKTILMYAAESGDISKFRTLLDLGAPSEGVDKDGKSVLDYAKGKGKCFADAVARYVNK